MLFLCYVLLLVIRASPWWQPQYLIPVLGLIMGHAISGIAVGLSALLEELNSGGSLSCEVPCFIFPARQSCLVCCCTQVKQYHSLNMCHVALKGPYERALAYVILYATLH